MKFKLLGTIVSTFIGFYLNLYLPLSLGENAFYVFSVLQLFSNKFYELFDTGSSAISFYMLIDHKHNNIQTNKITFSYITYSLISIILLAITLFIYNKTIDEEISTNSILFGAIYFYFIWLIGILNKFSDALEFTKQSEIIRISLKLILFLILFPIQYLGYELNLNTFLIISISIYAVFIITHIRLLKIKPIKFHKSISKIKKIFSKSRKLSHSNLSILIISSIDLYLLGTINNGTNIASFNFFNQTGMIIYILSPIMVPIFTRTYRKNINQIQLTKQLIYSVFIALTIVLILFNEIISLIDKGELFDEMYYIGYFSLMNFSLLILIRYFTNIAMLEKKDRSYKRKTLIIQILSGFLTLLLIRYSLFNTMSIFMKFLLINFVWLLSIIEYKLVSMRMIIDVFIITCPTILLFLNIDNYIVNIILSMLFIFTIIKFKIIRLDFNEIFYIFKHY